LLPLVLSGGALACSGAPPAATPAPTDHAAPTAGAAPVGGWVDAAVAAIRVDKGDAGGMRGCPGTLTPEAKAFFKKVYAEAARCATTGSKPGRGSITFHSTLEEGGGLSEFSVIDDKLGAPAVVSCIQEKATSVEFPKVDPKTPCVQLVHPMTFP
jgi:hypothetical protein